MRKKINCYEANQLSIVDFLERNSITPTKIIGNEYWYYSPFREETQPSFHVNIKLNRWYNFQDNTGGKLIDLIIKLYDCSVTEALEKVSQINPFIHKPFNKGVKDKSNGMEITRVEEIKNHYLVNYIKSRKISLDIARNYCAEVYYKTNGKELYAIGFKNNSGGYELRTPYWKGTKAPKDITLIENGSKRVCVFEGFMDFLSLLEIMKDRKIHSDYLVLNSNANLNRASRSLINYERVYYFLDNDSSGNNTTEAAMRLNPNGKDCSDTYEKSEDLSDYVNNTPEEQRQWMVDHFFPLLRGEISQDHNWRKNNNRDFGLSM